MRLLAVDPGIRNTGIVLLDDGPRIVQAWTLRTSGDDSFRSAQHRCDSLVAQLQAVYQETGEVDHVAVEAYRDIPGRLRSVKNRWMCPLAIGRLTETLRLFSVSGHVVWQDPETVMRAYAGYVRAWASGQHIIAGSELLTNEHLRSAAAHALHLHDNMREAS